MYVYIIYVYQLVCKTVVKVLNRKNYSINIRKQYNQLKIRLGMLLLTSFVPHNLYDTHQIKLPKVQRYAGLYSHYINQRNVLISTSSYVHCV